MHRLQVISPPPNFYRASFSYLSFLFLLLLAVPLLVVTLLGHFPSLKLLLYVRRGSQPLLLLQFLQANVSLTLQQGSIYWKIPPWRGKISADFIWGKKYEKGNRKRGKM
jgi:hypothetical protein